MCSLETFSYNFLMSDLFRQISLFQLRCLLVSAQAGLLSGAVITLDTFLARRAHFLLFSVDLNHFSNSLCFLCALLLRAALNVTKWSNKSLKMAATCEEH